ncbi:hypothetical protein C7999DRAFT_35066 [Corynascus novoguineensis]|uniref:Uncharacterized protein n=1 Tax=Corynascus novoguineensis TaxID=1126955 RepID=A0AAN7HJQ3_9PEZI|nr:hypothetical protein C7999DRAFT_35066 [Corynascus novoguineensis]
MLRLTRLLPGQRAFLLRSCPHATTTTATINFTPVRLVTFITKKSNPRWPIILLTGTKGGATKPNPSSPQRFFARPPWTWSPSAISTLAFGSMLAGSWYIWEAARDYKVAAEADKHEPRVLGKHREGKVNRDYINYEQWIERHGRGKR